MNKINQEKTVVENMIRIYCRSRHNSVELCPECTELRDYAFMRLDKCVYGEDKMACKDCPVHCYKPDMRERVRKVMRYSGPRMLFYYPFQFLNHIIKK